MAAPKGCCAGKCLIKAIISVVVIVAIIVIAGAILVNQTPENLKIADVEIGGTTIREMGFADVKIKDFLKSIYSLLRPNEKNLVTNAPGEADVTSANDKLLDAGVEAQAGGAPNYLWLLDNILYTNPRQALTVTDKEFAVIMAGMLDQAGDNEDAKIIKDMNGKLEQVIITSNKVEVLISVDTSSLELPNVPAFLVPKKIFINSVNKLTVNSDGTLSTESQSVSINEMERALSDVILESLKSMTNSDKSAQEFINEATGNLFVTIAGNIGEAGTDESNIGNAAAAGSGYVKLVTRQEVV